MSICFEIREVLFPVGLKSLIMYMSTSVYKTKQTCQGDINKNVGSIEA